MSTKATIAHGEQFHLYEEVLGGGIYLELQHRKDASIEIGENRTYVKLRPAKELEERLKVNNQQLVESTSTSPSVSNITGNGKK